MSENQISSVVEASWRKYLDGLEDVRKLLYSQSWGNGAEARSAAHYYFHQLQAAAFNLVVGARQDYPTLYCHIASEPNVYTWGVPSADFKYGWAILDGSRTYRLFGRRRSSLFVDMQVVSKLFGGHGGKLLGSFDLDELIDDGQEDFDIVISAQPHDGVWIPLEKDSNNNLLLIREAFKDWGSEVAAEMHIELADGVSPGPLLMDDAELIARLDRAVDFIKFVVTKWAIASNNAILNAVGMNSFYQEPFNENAGSANNPKALYPSMIFDIKDDEAIIIELEVPEEIQYWNVQIGDIWHQAVDYCYHQSSLNMAQAVLDVDGKFRCVISLQDPGVSNWLDPVGLHSGFVIFRLYRFNRPVKPVARKVSFKSLSDELPKTTKLVSNLERKLSLSSRARMARSRYGY